MGLCYRSEASWVFSGSGFSPELTQNSGDSRRHVRKCGEKPVPSGCSLWPVGQQGCGVRATPGRWDPPNSFGILPPSIQRCKASGEGGLPGGALRPLSMSPTEAPSARRWPMRGPEGDGELKVHQGRRRAGRRCPRQGPTRGRRPGPFRATPGLRNPPNSFGILPPSIQRCKASGEGGTALWARCAHCLFWLRQHTAGFRRNGPCESPPEGIFDFQKGLRPCALSKIPLRGGDVSCLDRQRDFLRQGKYPLHICHEIRNLCPINPAVANYAF